MPSIFFDKHVYNNPTSGNPPVHIGGVDGRTDGRKRGENMTNLQFSQICEK
jgi:hypothetical protein